MSNDILTLILFFFLLVLAVEITILIITLLRDNTKTPQVQKPVEYQNPSFGSQTAYGRAWVIELWNANENTVLTRNFCGQLILGRRTTANELFWQMHISSDPSISREQCVIYDRGGFIVLENLSQVNITYCNGVPATMPTPLQQGTQLTMGRSQFYVANLQRIM